MPQFILNIGLFDSDLAFDRLRRTFNLSYTKQAIGVTYPLSFRQNEIILSRITEDDVVFADSIRRSGDLYEDVTIKVERAILHDGIEDIVQTGLLNPFRHVVKNQGLTQAQSQQGEFDILWSQQIANMQDLESIKDVGIEVASRNLGNAICMYEIYAMDHKDRECVTEQLKKVMAKLLEIHQFSLIAGVIIPSSKEMSPTILQDLLITSDAKAEMQMLFFPHIIQSDNAENTGETTHNLILSDNGQSEFQVMTELQIFEKDISMVLDMFVNVFADLDSHLGKTLVHDIKQLAKEKVVSSVLKKWIYGLGNSNKRSTMDRQLKTVTRGQKLTLIERKKVKANKYDRNGLNIRKRTWALRSGISSIKPKKYTFSVKNARDFRIDKVFHMFDKIVRGKGSLVTKGDTIFTMKDQTEAKIVQHDLQEAIKELLVSWINKVSYIQIDKEPHAGRQVYQWKYGILKDKYVIWKKVMIWDAVIELRQTWFVRETDRKAQIFEKVDKRGSKDMKSALETDGELMPQMIREGHSSMEMDEIFTTSKDNGTGVLFLEIQDVVTQEQIADILGQIQEMEKYSSEGIVTVLLFSGNQSEHGVDSNSPEGMLVIASAADGKGAQETVLNLLSQGYPKDGHSVDDIIKIQLVDKGQIIDPIRMLLDIATRDNFEQETFMQDIKELADRNNEVKETLELILAGLACIKDKNALKVLLQASAEVKKKQARFDIMKTGAWDTAWENLLDVKNKDKRDRIKVPNDDFNYAEYAQNVFDKQTGVPKDPKGATNKAEVKVSFPTSHFNAGYPDLERNEIPVSLYIFKDVMLLIWIFWCKHRVNEDIADKLLEFYQTENLDQTRMLEYSKIVSMSAPQALNYILDKVNLWIKDTIAYFEPGQEAEYQRVLRFVRWLGEKVSMDLCDYTLIREYDPWIPNIIGNKYDSTVTENQVQLKNGYIENLTSEATLIYRSLHNYIDGDFTFGALMTNTPLVGVPFVQTTLNVYLDGDLKYTIDQPGLYNGYNGTTLPTFQVPAGNHQIKFEFIGGTKCQILSEKLTGVVFLEARTRYDAQPKTGTLAVDNLLSLMYNYYEEHHEDKAKGQRQMWMKT